MGHKGKETTPEERRIIIRLLNQCKSYGEIAKIVGRPRSKIQSIINRICEKATYQNQPRIGRPRKTSAQDERFVVREITKDPHTSAPMISDELKKRGVSVSVSTARRILKRSGFHGRVPRKKFFVSEANIKKRLQFARKYANKPASFWRKVMFTDESKYNISGSDGRRMIWRQKNAELQPKNLRATVKHGGGSLMVLGAMSASGVGNLCFIDGIMDHKKYIAILKENLPASKQKMNLEDDYIFQQDNDPKHKAHNTMMLLLYNVPRILDFPPQSSDLNPIEHLRSYLEKKIRERRIRNIHKLRVALQEE